MTIFKRSMLTLGLAVLVFSAAVVISALVFMNSLYYEIISRELSDTAKTLMAVIGKDRITEIFAANADDVHISLPLVPQPGLEDEGSPLDITEAYRLTLIAPSGNVLWDSHVTDRIVNHIDREEVIAALEGREGSSWRDSLTTKIRQIYCALPVSGSGGVIGVFRLSIAVPGFSARISPVIVPFIIFSCLFVIAAFSAIFAFSRSLSISLGRLVKIAQEEAPQSIPLALLSGSGASESVVLEFNSLERTLKAMTSELNYRIDQAKAEGRRLEAILNGMSEAVFAMDSMLKLHLVNPRARELFHLGNRDISSMSLLEATRSTELTEAAEKALDDGVPLEMELTFHTGIVSAAANEGSRSSRGEWIAAQQFHVFASPLAGVTPETVAADHITQSGMVNESGGVVLVLQDITRLVKLERIRKDFVANVSHELRTPIQLIKGFSETLYCEAVQYDNVTEDSEKNKQIIHFLEIIRKNAGIMENLTNDLLTLADLENNLNIVRNLEEVNVAFLIYEAVSSTEQQAKRKQIEIIVNCPEDLNANLYGSLIIQALINLIDNGIKYSQSNSKIKITAYSENDELVLQVKDKGIGISAEHIEKIFERFYRVDKARSRDAGGTGLGLSIVRHIALLHKGKVEAESHAGEGSIFRIRIPGVL